MDKRLLAAQTRLSTDAPRKSLDDSGVRLDFRHSPGIAEGMGPGDDDDDDDSPGSGGSGGNIDPDDDEGYDDDDDVDDDDEEPLRVSPSRVRLRGSGFSRTRRFDQLPVARRRPPRNGRPSFRCAAAICGSIRPVR